MPHAFWQKQQSDVAAADSDAGTPPHTSPRGSAASSPGQGLSPPHGQPSKSPSPVRVVRQANKISSAKWQRWSEPQPATDNHSFGADDGVKGAEAGAEAEGGQPRARAGGPPVAHIRFGFCRSGFRHMHAALARTCGLLGRAQLLREWVLACSLCWWAAEKLLGRAWCWWLRCRGLMGALQLLHKCQAADVVLTSGCTLRNATVSFLVPPIVQIFSQRCAGCSVLSCMHVLNAGCCIVCCAALQPGQVQEKDDFGLPSSLDVEVSPRGPGGPTPRRKKQV